MEANVKVKSSSTDELYHVVFKIDKGLLQINCSCPAGEKKTLCKHRTNLLNASISELEQQIVNKSELSLLLDILSKSKTSIDKINKLFEEITALDEKMQILDNTRKKVKKDIGLQLSEGI
jgi:uncharacterized Zn finger protein